MEQLLRQTENTGPTLRAPEHQGPHTPNARPAKGCGREESLSQGGTLLPDSSWPLHCATPVRSGREDVLLAVLSRCEEDLRTCPFWGDKSVSVSSHPQDCAERWQGLPWSLLPKVRKALLSLALRPQGAVGSTERYPVRLPLTLQCSIGRRPTGCSPRVSYKHSVGPLPRRARHTFPV